MMNKLGISCLSALALLVAVPACSSEASTSDDADAAEASTSEEELSANAARLVGAYHGVRAGGSIPAFEGLVLDRDGTFFADVDTGVRCITTPCPSQERLEGRFTATKRTLRLTPKDAASRSSAYGLYRYTTTDGKLTLSRPDGWRGALAKKVSYCAEPSDCASQDLIAPKCVGDWDCTASRQCKFECGAPKPRAVWPADATKLVANNSGGGFTAPPPAGSRCPVGGAKYTLDVATKKLDWSVCANDVVGEPLFWNEGSRTLTAAQLATIDAAAKGVKLSTRQICGADKPLLTIDVTTPAGTKTYKDDFYSCFGQGPFVEGLDGLFRALRDAVGPIGG